MLRAARRVRRLGKIAARCRASGAGSPGPRGANKPNSSPPANPPRPLQPPIPSSPGVSRSPFRSYRPDRPARPCRAQRAAPGPAPQARGAQRAAGGERRRQRGLERTLGTRCPRRSRRPRLFVCRLRPARPSRLPSFGPGGSGTAARGVGRASGGRQGVRGGAAGWRGATFSLCRAAGALRRRGRGGRATGPEGCWSPPTRQSDVSRQGSGGSRCRGRWRRPGRGRPRTPSRGRRRSRRRQ